MSTIGTDTATSQTASPRLTVLLKLADSPVSSKVEYVIGGLELTGVDRETVAQLLADDAMRIRCGNSPMLSRWRTRRYGGPEEEPGARKTALETYAKLGFGLRDNPANDDHLQGLVAELLWNRLMKERLVCRDGRRLVRAHSVKPDPLEPGGDGLVVYEMADGVLAFRLWEIKKHEAQNRVSATIRRASQQLSSRGNEYLAKLAGPETVEEGGPLGEFYADIVELWLDGSDRAGAGVSVGTSAKRAPTKPRSFGSIATAFPQFKEPGQIESIVVGIPDFPEFSTRVREIVWSGL